MTWTKKKIITVSAISIIIPLLIIGAYIGCYKIRYYEDTATQTRVAQMRDMILLAVNSVKKNAPVDPRTGDVYFPEAKLYLPAPDTIHTLTYLNDTGDISNSGGELSVSTSPVMGSTRMYIATTDESLFEVVPKLQACSRGIKLVHQKFPATDISNVLRQEVQLKNGQKLYIYVEKDCPGLNPTADLFKNIKSY